MMESSSFEHDKPNELSISDIVKGANREHVSEWKGVGTVLGGGHGV